MGEAIPQTQGWFHRMGVGKTAYEFWDGVRNKECKERPDVSTVSQAVFHATGGIELKNEFVLNLKSGMKKYFGDIADRVMKLCLEGPDP